MSSRIWDAPCAVCGKYSLDCTCGLFDSKESESKQDAKNRHFVYELTGIRDESMHIKPYADMIEKMSYVQKADFAKAALDYERDAKTLKQMLEEVSRERNGWISEYRAARAEVERLKLERDELSRQAKFSEDAHAKLEEKLRIQYDAEFEAFKTSLINRTVARKDQLEEWLTEYRDQLKKENVFHKNQGIINAINELLNENTI